MINFMLYKFSTIRKKEKKKQCPQKKKKTKHLVVNVSFFHSQFSAAICSRGFKHTTYICLYMHRQLKYNWNYIQEFENTGCFSEGS